MAPTGTPSVPSHPWRRQRLSPFHTFSFRSGVRVEPSYVGSALGTKACVPEPKRAVYQQVRS